MMSGRPLLALLLLVGACSSEVAPESAPEGPGTRVAQAIVGGTPSTTSDDSVISIRFGPDADLLCTGTLITPNLVLTARHCISGYDKRQDCGPFTTQYVPSSLSIAVGVMPGRPVAVAKKFFVDGLKSASICSNDIALIQLDRDVPDAKLSKVRLTKPKVGEAARAVGYGDDGSGKPTTGRYEKAGLEVEAIGPASLTYESPSGESADVTVLLGELATGNATCFGDSGGPLFDGAGDVMGVTSRGVDKTCGGPSLFSDTASHAQFITDSAIAAGHPLGAPQAAPGGTGSSAAPSPSRPSTPTSSYRGQSDEGCSATPRPKPGGSSLVLAGMAALAVLGRRRSARAVAASARRRLAHASLGAANHLAAGKRHGHARRATRLVEAGRVTAVVRIDAEVGQRPVRRKSQVEHR